MGYKKNYAFGINFDEVGKAVEDFFNNAGINDVFSHEEAVTKPAINVYAHKNHLAIEVAAPGMQKEDFDLSIEDHVLTIEGKKEAVEKEDNVKIKRKEFNYSTFKRSFRLDTELDSQAISASYEQGILHIIIPKKSEEQRSKVKVEIN